MDMIDSSEEESGWQPVVHHGMTAEQCRAALIEANEPAEQDFREGLIADGIPLATIDRLMMVLHRRVVRQVDAMLPGVLLNLECSALAGDNLKRLH